MKHVLFETNKGNFLVELDDERAPKTVANFLAYVHKGQYTNTIFHRVIDGFMVQGGGFEPGMKQKTVDAPIRNEADNGLKNIAYSIAMARTNDPHSASAQFFINVRDNEFLNHTSATSQGWGYCVFGQVVAGQEVIDEIRRVRTGSKGFHQDVPLEDVIVTVAYETDAEANHRQGDPATEEAAETGTLGRLVQGADVERVAASLLDDEGLSDEQIEQGRTIVKEGLLRIRHQLGMQLNLEFDELNRRFPKER
jgi:peptidyl-prolyl cis-trans isomerase B (cyclophilin B)